MIIGVESHSKPGILNEYSTGTGSVFDAAFEGAFADNPATKLYEYYQKETAGGERLSKAEIEERVKSEGLSIGDIPEEGMNSEAVDLLVERQYDRRLRSEVINRAGGGFVNGAAEFAGGLAGSLFDPINIATSFIPVVGQARYASMLAKAGSPLARAGVRMGVGAAEGFVGSAMMEPINYGLSQELGDDYTSMDSLMNLAFGTVMGGGLHMGVGAISDRFLNPTKPIEPQGTVAKQVNALDPEMRMDYNQAAIAQAFDDKPINVEPIRAIHDLQIHAQIRELDVEIKNLTDQGLVDDASFLMQKKADLLDTIKEEIPGPVASPDVPGAALVDEPQVQARFRDEPDPVEVQRQVQDEVSKLPNSRFINDEIIAKHEAEFQNAPKDIRIEEATKELDVHVASLKEFADKKGLDVNELLKEADEGLAAADEYSNVVRAFADCATRKG